MYIYIYILTRLSHFGPITPILFRFIYCVNICQLTKSTGFWLNHLGTLPQKAFNKQKNRNMLIK